MIVVIGAGVAGLSAARALQDAGREVRVLEKARGVGGRCATRRIEGQPVDSGVAWFHGSDASFLAVFQEFSPDEVLDGWPRRVVGSGPPCHPHGLDAGQRRFALRDGASALPKRLAQGLDVRLNTRVHAVTAHADHLRVRTEDTTYDAEHVVFTLPAEQSSELLAGLEPDREVSAVRFLLGRVGSVACLTVLALYDLDRPDPGFDVNLPPLGGPLALIAHDSTKRTDPRFRALVLQASPAWSREHLERDPEAWSAALLDAAAEQVGPWVRSPRARQAHRWRYARVAPALALRSPVLLGSGSAKVALTGEAFHEGTGVQGAFLAGRRAAARLLEV